MDYYIENGVRRAGAAREAKLAAILARLHETGKPPTTILVMLDSLRSTKTSISRSHPRYISVVQGMSSPQSRARMPEIDVQLLGEPGQMPTVPLLQVRLDPGGARMKPMPKVLFKKLCFILHRGFVEARLLAPHRPQQAHDLADAFEIIPGYLPNWADESLDLIRSHLHDYQDKYGPSPFDYLAILEMDDAEFNQLHSRW